MLLQTPLYSEHQALGAKLIEFAGYEMPVRYAGDKQEHLAVRRQAGLFDVSHMGEFLIRGPKALELLQLVSSNDVSKLTVGKAQYGCLPNERGGVVDDMIIYRLEDELYMLVANAANIAKDWNWIEQHNKTVGAELENVSEQTCLLALSGPEAVGIITQLTNDQPEQLPFYACKKGAVAGIEQVLIATTGYTGERTFELYVRSKHAVELWRAILEAGQAHGIQPVGLGARDTLRLEMGYMLYGNDLTDDTLPLEAGLGWVTKLKKGPFVGRDALLAAKEAGLERRLVGLKLEGRNIPRAGSAILKDGQEIGRVTSGSFSPSLEHGIGLGYVPLAYKEPGTELQVLGRRDPAPAVVAKPPFVKDTSLSRWLNK